MASIENVNKAMPETHSNQQQQHQQLSTDPGYFPQTAATGPTQTVVVDAPKLPFRDQVIADAKIIRGTLLGQKDTKEHGQKILAGELPAREPKRKMTEDVGVDSRV
ncbi:hypothetical protein BKA62DRAFT_704634 [Auriculariales sp. MPI-PUGE-AT-0066]|nr:hypothetical protein BKA62DRAFT_704634 [Auriculariales sp. MPI-PUGE-AT-0066]